MNQKHTLAVFCGILITGIAGYFVLASYFNPVAERLVFPTQEECEKASGEPCAYYMCDYIPPEKTFEEVCGKNFRKGWAPYATSTLSRSGLVVFERIDFAKTPLLGRSFGSSECNGVFRNIDELKEVWRYVENTNDGLDRIGNVPLPMIDFSKYSVIWYSDRCIGNTATTLEKVSEFEDFIEARVMLFYSDYGSSKLNLWIIPKTDKKVRFVEEKQVDTGFSM